MEKSWRGKKRDPSIRVSFSERLYWGTGWPLCPCQEVRTVSPWPCWPSWATQSVYLEGRFRAEKRKEHAWTFLPRSPGRVWKNGGISNILLPKNKTFPLITWKEQAICLQKLQAVVITLLLLNFLEEYLIVKRNLTTLIFLRCTGNVHA